MMGDFGPGPGPGARCARARQRLGRGARQRLCRRLMAWSLAAGLAAGISTPPAHARASDAAT
ncbi:MAG TPA: hypothetical protein VGP07_21345, partial [Polyangia bacterium]